MMLNPDATLIIVTLHTTFQTASSLRHSDVFIHGTNKCVLITSRVPTTHGRVRNTELGVPGRLPAHRELEV